MKVDFTGWMKRWSTWLASASASATAALGAYTLLPERVQTLFPDWVMVSLGAVAVISALLVPVATSLKQTKLQT